MNGQKLLSPFENWYERAGVIDESRRLKYDFLRMTKNWLFLKISQKDSCMWGRYKWKSFMLLNGRLGHILVTRFGYSIAEYILKTKQ